MRVGQGVRTGLGHEGITCVLQTQYSSFFFLRCFSDLEITRCHNTVFLLSSHL